MLFFLRFNPYFEYKSIQNYIGRWLNLFFRYKMDLEFFNQFFMFIKKFLFSFLTILGYMVVMAAIGLPLFLFEQKIDQNLFLTLLFIWVAAVIILFFPFLLLVVYKIWFFCGQGTPIALSELKKQLLEINQFDVPVTVQETKRGGLNFTWKYLDAKWWEFLAKAGLTQSYELRARFNERKHEVVLIDVSKSLSWRAGVGGVRFGWLGFRGIQMTVAVGQQYGIKENFSPGKIYDFKFNPSEIKIPVMNTILKNGWNVRFGIF